LGPKLATSIRSDVSHPVETLNILDVELTEKFGFSSHIKHLTIKARQSFYALRILRSHRLWGDSLHVVVRATTVGMMLYCSPVWWGFARAQEQETHDGIIQRLVRQEYLPPSSPSFVTLQPCGYQTLCLYSVQSLPFVA